MGHLNVDSIVIIENSVISYTNMTKKITFIAERYRDGAPEINRLIGYTKGFAAAGYSVRLIFMMPDKKEFNSSRNEMINVINLHSSKDKNKNKYLLYLSSCWKLAKLIKSKDLCFVYFNNFHTFVPTALNSKNVIGEVTEHPFFSGEKSIIKKLMFKYKISLKSRIKALFVISTSLKDYFQNKGFDSSKLKVINMFVDESRFSGIERRHMDKNITYCGTVTRGKDGVDILLESFKIFSQKHPDYKLNIIGKGIDENIIPQLKRIVKEIGLDNKVYFLGQIPATDIPQNLKNASILALSRPDNIQAKNGFPTKLGEYLMTENPVVVTSVGDIPLFIEDKKSGILAEPNSVEDFARQLCWVADNPEKAIIIGREGRKLAEKEFSNITEVLKAINFLNEQDSNSR